MRSASGRSSWSDRRGFARRLTSYGIAWLVLAACSATPLVLVQPSGPIPCAEAPTPGAVLTRLLADERPFLRGFVWAFVLVEAAPVRVPALLPQGQQEIQDLIRDALAYREAYLTCRAAAQSR